MISSDYEEDDYWVYWGAAGHSNSVFWSGYSDTENMSVWVECFRKGNQMSLAYDVTNGVFSRGLVISEPPSLK